MVDGWVGGCMDEVKKKPKELHMPFQYYWKTIGDCNTCIKLLGQEKQEKLSLS